eukprot:TRINITY_DN6410_c0_g1_i1.p1 TRINITY_DN6410_c0_g1~~TRINITY_DN6410_c0_g1_i1.p1  ORF type:complete len:477 (-),score=141.37 TRINITY_DN6410_c0_g1_i1:60-1490(-)
MVDHLTSHKHLTSVCLVIIIILVFSNVSTLVKYKESSNRFKRETVEVSVERQRQFIQELLNQTTKRPMSNTLKKKLFQEKYERPLDKLVKTFPKHPNAVVSKLLKEIKEEEAKAEVIEEEIGLIKSILGIPVDTNKFIKNRKKRSIEDYGSDADSYLPPCPTTSPHLLGALIVNQNIKTVEEAEENVTKVAVGGKFSPPDCKPRQKVAFVIPFRDRDAHLATWLSHMHPILQRQQLDYQVFVVEQADKLPFNRAALMNVGFLEASKISNFSCFIFHDVDMVPETDRAIYKCPGHQAILHMAVAVSRWKYRLTYPRYCGGITAMSTDNVRRIQGFSNTFYGWGGEDDDLYNRLIAHNLTIERYPGNIARYKMLKHDAVEENPDLKEMMEKSEGDKLLNEGLDTIKYKLKKITQLPLYTKIQVKLPVPPKKRKKGWLEYMKKNIDDAQNKLANSLAEKIQEFSEDIFNPEDNTLKIYY